MKKIAIILFVLCGFALQAQQTLTSDKNVKNEKQMNIYQFTVQDIEGNSFSFRKLEGRKIMIVNTASECGLTPQYEELEKLYETYKSKNFVIIAFPANNFNGQEPGTNEQIAVFCKKNYGVTFPVMSKVSVAGKDICELYKFLTQKELNGFASGEVKWNFQKYLINEKGELVKVLDPQVKPLDQEIIDWIEKK